MGGVGGRERKRERQRERNINVGVSEKYGSRTCPDWEWNLRPFGKQAGAPTNQATWPGLAKSFCFPFTDEETVTQRDIEMYNTIRCYSIFPAIFFPHFRGLEQNQCVTEITPNSSDYFYKLIKIKILSVSKELGYSWFYINYVCDTFSR